MRQETDEQKQRAAIGKRAGLVGLLCNFLLAGGKLAVGSLAASMAIFADGLNNLSDGASSLVTLLGFKLGSARRTRSIPTVMPGMSTWRP